MREIPALLKIILWVATLIVLVALVNAIDQYRISNYRLMDKLNSSGASTTNSSTETPKNLSEKVKEGDFANLEFYDPERVTGDRIIGVINSDTPNLNTIITNDATASMLNSICSSSLAERNYAEPGKFEPAMAESWEVSEDRLVYSIKLRPGIFWHDFTDPVSGVRHEKVPVTAHDFKFFIDVIKNPRVNCEPIRVYYQDLRQIEVIDDLNFKVYWEKPYYMSLSSTLGMSPLPRHLYWSYEGEFDPEKFNTDHERNRIIVGCGAYRFVEWEKGKKVIFERNDNYFGIAYGAGPALQRIEYEIIKLPGTAFQALLSGVIDHWGMLPELWKEKNKYAEFDSGKLKSYRYPARSFSYIGYNRKLPLFQDKKVRQALTMLVDREKIVRDIYYGEAVIATSPFAYDVAGVDPEIKPWPYDVARAKELLAEAGWAPGRSGFLEKDGVKFEFTILQVANHPLQQKMLPMIKESMAAAGIDMKIQIVEWSVLIQRLEKRNFEACTLGWALTYDPDLYQIFHSSQIELENSSNFISYSNAEVDELILKLRMEFDPVERQRIIKSLHHLMHDDQPYTFLVIPNTLMALDSRYRNVREFKSGVPRSLFWTPVAEQLGF